VGITKYTRIRRLIKGTLTLLKAEETNPKVIKVKNR